MADAYTVTNQRQTTRLNGGTFQDVMEVTFQTATGATGSVTLPLSQYTPANVKAAIEARVQVLDEVHNL